MERAGGIVNERKTLRRIPIFCLFVLSNWVHVLLWGRLGEE